MAIELSVSRMSQLIYLVRGMRVMLDHDLSDLFEIETKNLKRLVRRNTERFPTDLMFELTTEEQEVVSTQKERVSALDEEKTHGGVRYAPFAFTQGGVAMLSCLLSGNRPIQVSIYAMRAFSFGNQVRDESRQDALRQASEVKQDIIDLKAKYDKLANSVDQILARQSTRVERAIPTIPESTIVKKVEKIQKVVAKVYRVKVSDMMANRRNKEIVLPRQVAMFIARKNTGLSYSEIGSCFNRKDHTTVMHAYSKIQELQKSNEVIKGEVEAIEACLRLEDSA